MLLFDHLQDDQPSLQQHSFALLDDSGTEISKQGIDKRFNPEAVAFLQALFEQYLNYNISSTAIPSGLKEHFSAIRIMDSTEFSLPASMAKEFPGFEGDGTAACAQIQLEYDILSGKINQLAIENARVSDVCYAVKSNDTLQAGELVLRDLGYYTLKMYQEIEDRAAFFVSRIKTQVKIFEKDNDNLKELTYQEILERLSKSKEKYLDIDVFIGKEKMQRVRLIANLLEEEAINRRVRRKKLRKSKLNSDDELWTQLNLFITNVSREHFTADEVYQLYKIRWQVELIFKTWKSILNIDKVRKMKTDRFRCYLISKLIWIMINWDIVNSISDSILLEHKKLISFYKCFSIIKAIANQIRRPLFTQEINELKTWLSKLYKAIKRNGMKEERNNRARVIIILKAA